MGKLTAGAINLFVRDIEEGDKVTPQDADRLNPELLPFMQAFQSKNPNEVKFSRVNPNIVLVYVEGEVMVRGALGYGDFRKNPRNFQPKFAIWSTEIKNERKGVYLSEHIKMTKDLARAGNLARSYLLSRTNADVCRHTSSDFEQKHDSQVFQIKSHFRDLKNKINENFEPEKYSTVAEHLSGIKNQLTDTMSEFSECAKKLYKIQSGRQNLSIVTVEQKNGQVVCAMTPIHFGSLKSVAYSFEIFNLCKENLYKTVRYTEENLPPSLLERLSVLNICDDMGHVPDVGMKVNPQVFYVYDLPEEQDNA